MFIETWVAAFIVVCVFFGALVCCFGWIVEGERLAKAQKENKKLIAENGRLLRVIDHLNGDLNIKAADKFYNKEN